MTIKTSGLEMVVVRVRLGLLGRALVLVGLEAFLVGLLLVLVGLALLRQALALVDLELELHNGTGRTGTGAEILVTVSALQYMFYFCQVKSV